MATSDQPREVVYLVVHDDGHCEGVFRDLHLATRYAQRLAEEGISRRSVQAWEMGADKEPQTLSLWDRNGQLCVHCGGSGKKMDLGGPGVVWLQALLQCPHCAGTGKGRAKTP